MPAPLAPVDPVAALRPRVGGALEQVVRLADGRLLGVVRGEAPADAVEGAVLLPAGAAAALAALVLFREALTLGCRALDPRGDPGAEPAALLAAIHGHLLPARLLTEAEASALARVGEAARAFGSSTVEPPESLVAAASTDAVALLARARVAVS